MSVRTLKEYIKLIIKEVVVQARVPTQLLPPEETEDEESGKDSEGDAIDEFSGVGSIAGYTAPLGGKFTRPKAKKRT